MNIELPRQQFAYLESSYDVIPFKVTSVGVWTIVNSPATQNHYFLLVQQKDQPQYLDDSDEIKRYRWGIPAGRVEKNDLNIYDAARREVYEETGIQLQGWELLLLTAHRRRISNQKNLRHKTGIIFAATIDISRLTVHNALERQDGLILYDPPPTVDQNEVHRLALVPTRRLFNGIGITLNHHWRSHLVGYNALYRVGMIPA